MKTTIFFILLLALIINAQAKKKKQKHHDSSVAKDHIFTGFRVPIFAMRFPVFGGHALEDNTKPTDLTYDDGKKVKLQTKTKTSNSTHGPFKTYTVTSITTSPSNKSNPRIFEKVVKSVTTMNKNTSGKNFKIPRIKETHISIFRPFGIFGGFDGFDDKPEPECSDKKPCAAEQFCDKIIGVCKKQVAKGKACSQKDQCSKKSGNLQCTWGRCIINNEVGGMGTFCDEHKECQSSGVELGCFARPEISRFSKVCIAKLQEGETCGKRSLFSMFDDEDDAEDDRRCKSDLVCRVAGFYGYKICQKAPADDQPHKTVTKKSKRKHH